METDTDMNARSIEMKNSKTPIQQKSLNYSDLKLYAVTNYARELIDSRKSRLSGNEIKSLIDYEARENQFSSTEQKILSGIYWKMHYHFEDFKSDIEFAMKKLSEEVSMEKIIHDGYEAAFNSPIPDPIPIQESDDKSFYESQYSKTQIEAMLDLGRFLATKRFALKTKHDALKFVAKLISSDFIREATLNDLHKNNHAEFERLFDRCVQSLNSDSISTIEEVYIKLVEKISQILRDNQYSIPQDVDDFILKLVACDDFRDNILKNIRDINDRDRIIRYCKLLLKNEIGKDDI